MVFEDIDSIVSFVKKGVKLPDWQTKLFEKNASAVQVHSQGHVFFKIDRLFPNEHPTSKAHRVLSFESITEASFGRAANNVNRIFKNSSYTVEANEKTMKLVQEHNFGGQNFFNWFLDEWVKVALKQDPNALIVVYPPDYVKEEGRPQVVFIPSAHIKHMDADTIIFVSEEESQVEYDIKEVTVSSKTFYDQSINGINSKAITDNTFTPIIEGIIKRHVYHVFQKDQGFFRLEQLEKDKDKYEVVQYDLPKDFLPIVDVGGEKGQRNVNKSFLHPFVPFGNLALLQHSQHTAVNFNFSFPRMSEIETPCEAEGCNGGWIICETQEDLQKFGEKKSCGVCGGTGGTTRQSPYKIYKKRFDPNMGDGEKYLDVPDVQFYTPDVAILDYSKEEWKNYLEMAEAAVYIQQRVQTGNVESADSKEIDREDLYAFLARVGQVFFSKLRFCLQSFENYLVASPGEVVVNIPFSYAILTEGEAYEALQKILASNVPVMLKANQTESFINKFVSQSSPLRKFIDVLKLVDPLLFYTAAELQTYKASGIVTAEQMSIHVFAYPMLSQMWSKAKNIFVEKEADAIAEALLKEVEKFKPEQPTDLKTKLIEANAA